MMQNKIKIAITGGIGSGKSEVCKIIAKQNYPVYSCDEIYKQLCIDKDFLRSLEIEFSGVLTADGKLDRTALADLVFSDNSKLEKLNSITHNRIFDGAFKAMDSHDLSFLEVPLLFEGGYEGLFDGVLVVLRDKEKRIQSVINRSKLSKKDVILRINSQFDYDNTSFAKYYVVHNNGNLTELEQSMLRFLKNIKMQFKKI